MKILIAADTYPPDINGASLATHKMASELVKRGHQVFVLAPSNSTLKHSLDEKDGVKIYRLRAILVEPRQNFRLSLQPMHMRRANKIIKDLKPDIIHINNPGFISRTAMYYGRKMGIPVVGTSHYMPENIIHHLHLPYLIDDMVNSILWRDYARMYSKLEKIICPTETAERLLKRFKSVKNTIVISNGLDFTKFKKEIDPTPFKKKFNIKRSPVILFVGRIEKEKQIDVLIKAASEIKDHDFQLVIVGKGKEIESLQDLAEKLKIADKTIFTGYVSDEDLLGIYHASDIFVMPSIAELQSLVTMDAMATDLPVIGADAVALPHLIKNDINGYLFEPGNHYELARRLLTLIKDETLRKKMGKESLRIIKDHDMDFVIKQIEEVYQEVLEKK